MQARALLRVQRPFGPLGVGLVQKLGHGGHGGLGLAGLEVEPGAHGAQKRAVGGPLVRQEAVELRAKGVGAPRALKELQQREPVLPGGRLGIDAPAQKRLGTVEIAFRDQKAQVGLGDLPVVGKELGRPRELRAEALAVLQPRQDADPEAAQLHFALVQRQPVVHQGQGSVGATLSQHPVDHHEARGGQGRIVRQHRAGGLRRVRAGGLVLGLHGVPVGKGGGGGPQAGIVRREGESGLGVPARLVPVARVHRQKRQGPPPFHVLGILLHEAQVVAEGPAQVPVGDQELGIGIPGVSVKAVEVEHVPELELGAHRIARRDQPQRLLVVRLGALLGALAGGQEHEKEGGKEVSGAHGNPGPAI